MKTFDPACCAWAIKRCLIRSVQLYWKTLNAFGGPVSTPPGRGQEETHGMRGREQRWKLRG